MGRALDEWRAKVAELVRDPAGRDLSPLQVEAVGLRPAFARFSKDRPLEVVAEVAGAGSAYFPLPAAWAPGLSSLRAVEYPARADPPAYLDAQSWRLGRSADDVTVARIMLDRSPAASEWVRFTFTARWPFPDDEPATDEIEDDVAFEAVAALAASYCCRSLANEAARRRSAAMPTDFVEGRDRAEDLAAAGDRYEAVYAELLGLTEGAESGGSTSPPAWGSFDFDPSRASLFHGGRR